MGFSSDVFYQQSFHRGLVGPALNYMASLFLSSASCGGGGKPFAVGSTFDLRQAGLKGECPLALSTSSAGLPSQAFLWLLGQMEIFPLSFHLLRLDYISFTLRITF